MTEATAGQYLEESTVQITGDGTILGFDFCNLPASTSDTTNLCVGDEIFATDELTGDCQYVGTEEDFTFHCESVVSPIDTAECMMFNDFQGHGTRSGENFEITLTWTYDLVGPDCDGSCTITITSTATRLGEPVCDPLKNTKRAPLIRLPVHTPK